MVEIAGVRLVSRGGLVHAWVGQIVLVCNEFKTLFVRPAECELSAAPALSAAMAALG